MTTRIQALEALAKLVIEAGDHAIDVDLAEQARLAIAKRHTTEDQQAEIIADFVRWSGGFAPHEVELSEVMSYVESTILHDEIDRHPSDVRAHLILAAADLITNHLNK